MQAQVTDATSALLGALRCSIGEEAQLTVEKVASRRWASITFTGARHELQLRLIGKAAVPASERFIGSLAAAEFDLRGHVVADIALVAQERVEDGVRLVIEALTVEEA